MNRLIHLMLAVILAAASSSLYAGTPVRSSDLPKAARTFLTTHFPGDNIIKVEKDQGRRGMEYEVDLQSGAEIDFRDNGDWKDVKAARGKAVPAAIVPAAIAKYVSANHKGKTIVEISRKRGGYEVELSDDTELHLTDDGKPMPARTGRGPRH